MCDWEEQGFAEYLLWVEQSVRVRARAPKDSLASEDALFEPALTGPPPVSVEV
ncbi:MAG: hypothetical protein ACLP8Y_01635 [Thermoplasmata archaeon]